MKRSDLKNTAVTRTRTNRTSYNQNNRLTPTVKIFPWIHLLQIIVSFSLLLLIMCKNSIDDEEVLRIFTILEEQLNHTIEFKISEWSGSLKDIVTFGK